MEQSRQDISAAVELEHEIRNRNDPDRNTQASYWSNPSPFNFDLGADYFGNVFTASNPIVGLDNAGKGFLELANDLGIGFLTAASFGAFLELMPVAAGNVATPSGKQFSVAFETKLSSGTFPGKGRGVHFRDANLQLAATMKANPEFTASMEKLIPGISDFLKTPSMASRSPTTLGWTWHHNVETGVMDLVPFSQHTDQLFQNAFHPGGVGGFSILGK